jgi:hypothetical protein
MADVDIINYIGSVEVLPSLRIGASEYHWPHVLLPRLPVLTLQINGGLYHLIKDIKPKH